jgi:ribose transport system ATP-binding protein
MDHDNTTPILEMRGISKSFPGVQALDGVDFTLRRGEVHIVLGENGAGKSTLMKVLAGVYPKDAGEILMDGRPVEINGVADAARHGIAMIPQELDLIPTLTVAENLYLGREEQFSTAGFIRNGAQAAAAREAMKRLRVDVDPDTEVRRLGVAVQQMVAIARALEQQPTILVMDEPTAALGAEETEVLFEAMRRLIRERGLSICYISHRLEEFARIGDRVTVLRDGRYVATLNVPETSTDEMVRLMVGRQLTEYFPKQEARPGAEALRVEGLTRPGVLSDVSFTLREGEVVGLFGLVGAGRTELARAVFGADPVTKGRIRVNGREARIAGPADAVRLGIAYLTEDRKNQGLLLRKDLAENVTLAAVDRVVRGGLIQPALEREAARAAVAELSIRTPGVDAPVETLSGGNQQKVVLARWLFTQARIFLFDEPTRGIDVGAKAEIYGIMNRLTAGGAAILMISSELPEVLAMSDRILVMHEGRLTAEYRRGEATEEAVMRAATGQPPS